MKIKDLYNMLDNFHGLRGMTLVDGDNYIMYTTEALGLSYLERSTAYIKEFTYKDGYLTVYI